jgi:hypothetical protein
MKMAKKEKKRKFNLISILLLLIILPISYAQNQNETQNEIKNNINFELVSPKTAYFEGEEINFSLNIINNNLFDIDGKMSGKIIIGDIGFEIECFNYMSSKNSTQNIKMSPMPASFSNSNQKMMSSLYYCDGKRIQSTKTFVTNRPINSNKDIETFNVGPFNYTFEYEGEKIVVQSNTLNITVIPNNQNNNQNQNSGQSQQSQNNGNNNPTQGQQNQGQNQQNLNPSQNQPNQGQNQQNTQSNIQQTQQNLINNQNNAAAVNNIKKEIDDSKKNPLDPTIKTEEKKRFWIWFVILILTLTILLYYFKKETSNHKENNNEEEKLNNKKHKKPQYLKLLDNISKDKNRKENSLFLSKAIREFLKEKLSLDKEISNNEAIKIIENIDKQDNIYNHKDKLIEILKICELIEFANKNKVIDFEREKEFLKKIFKKNLEELKNENQ